METVHIELDVRVEQAAIEAFGNSVENLKIDLTKRIEQWVNQYLHPEEVKADKNPWIEFLDHIDQYAVDTGIEDLSINHEYYLHGGTKRQRSLFDYCRKYEN